VRRDCLTRGYMKTKKDLEEGRRGITGKEILKKKTSKNRDLKGESSARKKRFDYDSSGITV